MKRFLLLAVAAFAFSRAAQAADTYYVEKGRWGFETALAAWDETGDEDMYFGPAYFSDSMEAVLGLGWTFVDLNNSDQTVATNPVGDFDVLIKIGKRWNLHSGDYLSFGLIYEQPLWAHDSNGVSEAGTFSVGPYIGIQRPFAGTPLQFTVWIQPYTWNRMVYGQGNWNAATGTPGSQATVTQQFFQNGGMGLSYLFE